MPWRGCYDVVSRRRSGFKLGIDVGDVLSKKRRGRPWDCPPWCSADATGAYAFVVLFIILYGPLMLVIISRTGSGKWYDKHGYEHWVVQFLRQLGLMAMGVPEGNIKIC